MNELKKEKAEPDSAFLFDNLVTYHSHYGQHTHYCLDYTDLHDYLGQHDMQHCLDCADLHRH